MYCDKQIVYRRCISLVVYNWFVHEISVIELYLLHFFLHQMTPLHFAAESGRIKILNYLVEQGAPINIQDDNGVITSIIMCLYISMLVD